MDHVIDNTILSNCIISWFNALFYYSFQHLVLRMSLRHWPSSSDITRLFVSAKFGNDATKSELMSNKIQKKKTYVGRPKREN